MDETNHQRATIVNVFVKAPDSVDNYIGSILRQTENEVTLYTLTRNSGEEFKINVIPKRSILGVETVRVLEQT